MLTIEAVKEIAETARRAMEPYFLEHGVAGYCNTASFALKEALSKADDEEWTVVQGGVVTDAAPEGLSHCWLVREHDGLLVDITGDQFGFDPVMVEDEFDMPDFVPMETAFAWDQHEVETMVNMISMELGMPGITP